MKLSKFTKRAAALGLAVGLAAGVSTVAFAYFTTTGTGTGNASVGTATTKFTVKITAPTGGPLLPTVKADTNKSVETFSYTVKNKSEADEYLATVTFVVTSTGAATCQATWFIINGGTTSSTVTPKVTLKPNSDTPANHYTSSFTVQLIESTGPQTACKGASPVIKATAK